MNLITVAALEAESMIYMAIIALSIAIGVLSVVGFFAYVTVWIRYHAGNRKEVSCDLTGQEAVCKLLEQKGLNDVRVAKMGFFRALFMGNHYHLSKKIIYLRKNIFKKRSITAVTLACQKVGHAIAHANGDKKEITFGRLRYFVFFAPLFSVTFSIIGFLLDLFIFKTNGVFTVVAIAFAAIIYLLGFVYTALTVPVEKNANKLAAELMREANLLTEDEQKTADKVLKAYITAYVIDFLVAVLQLVKFILQVILKGMLASKKQ